MALKLQPLPSPRGTNLERLFVLKVPTGSKRGQLALDAALANGEKERPWDTVTRIASNAGLKDEEMAAFMRALEALCEQRDAGDLDDVDPDGDPETTLDVLGETVRAHSPAYTEEVFERPGSPGGVGRKEGSYVDRRRDMPEWAAIPGERLKRWSAVDRFLRAKGVGSDDLAELKGKWQERFGMLPNAIENGLGGLTRPGAELPTGDRRLARDRARARRQVAFDARYPEATRLEPRSALETSYGVRAAERREPIAQGTVDRWGDLAVNRIGIA
jgi:hypothetical protein